MGRRAAIVVSAAAVAAAAWLAGVGLVACDSLPVVFACSAAADCLDGQTLGTCEPTGYCAFPDVTCTESGRRYGAYAGDGLGDTCVGAVTDGGIGDGGLTNLLTNPGCEDGLATWSEFQSILSVSTIAHSGSLSCQACLEPGYGEFTFDDDDQGMSVVYSPQAGQVYRASAWVRSSPGVAAGQTVTITLREWDGADNPGANHSISEPLVLTEAWQYVEVTHTIVASCYAMDVFVGNHTARAGDCFLADDLAVYRLK
jgi:hypothetical protein